MFGWEILRSKKKKKEKKKENGRENIYGECLVEGKGGKNTGGAQLFSSLANQS